MQPHRSSALRLYASGLPTWVCPVRDMHCNRVYGRCAQLNVKRAAVSEASARPGRSSLHLLTAVTTPIQNPAAYGTRSHSITTHIHTLIFFSYRTLLKRKAACSVL